jgi:hypothetical protein
MRSIVALVILAIPSLVTAQAPTASEGHLAVAINKNRQLFANTTLDRNAVDRLSIGDASAALEAFALVDDQRLVDLAASVFQVDPAASVIIWADESTDSLDRVLRLINRASARIGQGLKPARLFVLPNLFPPGRRDVIGIPGWPDLFTVKTVKRPSFSMELTGLIDLSWYRASGATD